MSKAWGEIVPSSRVAFIKMQGLHNHFVIVDGRQTPYRPTTAETIQICDVKTGVGGDQLLVIQPPTKAGSAAGAHAFMRIINIDGQDAEACGNATRCFGWLMLEETGTDEIILETVVGPLKCKRVADKMVSVEMGEISTDWVTIPLAEQADTLRLPVGNGPLQNGVALNIGNPHVVYFVDDLDAVDVAKHGREIQNDPLFPEKINVGVAQIVSDNHIRLSVFERPGILTSACGSGACVTTRAAQLLGLADKGKVTVEMTAGSVEIEMREDNSAIMTGPVEFCFSGQLTGFEGPTK
jgi:diaminopimelate epimerase